MEEISQELVERAIALVRQMGGNSSLGEPYANESAIRFSSDHYDEARAIAAMLPVPVDPDLVEARRCVFDTSYGSATTSRVMAGLCDDEPAVRIALFALKRGRELAKARAGEGSV